MLRDHFRCDLEQNPSNFHKYYHLSRLMPTLLLNDFFGKGSYVPGPYLDADSQLLYLQLMAPKHSLRPFVYTRNVIV
jgi:hypothetical protein